MDDYKQLPEKHQKKEDSIKVKNALSLPILKSKRSFVAKLSLAQEWQKWSIYNLDRPIDRIDPSYLGRF